MTEADVVATMTDDEFDTFMRDAALSIRARIDTASLSQSLAESLCGEIARLLRAGRRVDALVFACSMDTALARFWYSGKTEREQRELLRHEEDARRAGLYFL